MGLEELVRWLRAKVPDWVGQAVAGLVVVWAVAWVAGWWPDWGFGALAALVVVAAVIGGLVLVGRRSTVAGLVGAGVAIAVVTAVVTVRIMGPRTADDAAPPPGTELPAPDSCGLRPPA